jgi:hypothetical protein
LFTRNELIQINVNKYFSPINAYILLCSFFKYLKNYFKNNDFIGFSNVLNQKKNDIKKQILLDHAKLKSKIDIGFTKCLIYIPFVNFIFLFFKNTRYSLHIINGITITVLLSIVILLSFITSINNNIFILFFFPVLF